MTNLFTRWVSRPATRSPSAILAVVALLSLTLPTQAGAQAQEAPRSRRTVISANPFGLLLELFNAEIEHAVSSSLTAGVGGSTVVLDGQDYRNLDAFVRFYPQGSPLQGWALGAKAGITQLPGSGTYPGFGFDVNWSTLTGADDRFYIGLGFGLKRLLVGGDEFLTPQIVPTLRLVNIGWMLR